jgi:glucose/arabinose dehydrogenase
MRFTTAAAAPLLLIASALPTNAQPQFRPTGSPPVDNLTVETVASGLSFPWAIAFLPDGRMLVTERPGRMRIVAKGGNVSPPVAGVPQVFARSQGGLHDVIVDRDFANNRTIYFCFAMPVSGGAQTALARARLTDGDPPRLDDVRVIFQQAGPPSSGNHFGCRIAQARDGNLFLTTGDHFRYRDDAQNLGNHLGKVIRLTPDGRAPPDNPFVKQAGAKPEIWS